MDSRTIGGALGENKEAPKDMPNIVMDLSYALDHQPGEVMELEYAEESIITDKVKKDNWLNPG